MEQKSETMTTSKEIQETVTEVASILMRGRKDMGLMEFKQNSLFKDMDQWAFTRLLWNAGLIDDSDNPTKKAIEFLLLYLKEENTSDKSSGGEPDSEMREIMVRDPYWLGKLLELHQAYDYLEQRAKFVAHVDVIVKGLTN
jgi:hypothetical protein